MDATSFFSVIIPTYNRPELLKRALESVLNQSFQSFELIIVNDGSINGLNQYEVLKREYSANNKIIFFDKQNEGLSAARNSGIKLAKSKFICFLDDDDYYLENHLDELHKLILEKNEAIGVYRTFTLFKESETSIIPQKLTSLDSEHPVVYVLLKLITSNNVCFERSIFDYFLFNTKVKIAEDYEMWVKVLFEYPLFETFVHTTVYDKTGETMSSGSLANNFKYIDTFELIFSNPKAQGVISPIFIKEKYKMFYSWIIEEYLIKNDVFSFKKLRVSIIKHTGFLFYFKHYLRFLKKHF